MFSEHYKNNDFIKQENTFKHILFMVIELWTYG